MIKMKMKMNGDVTKTNNESRRGCLIDDKLMIFDDDNKLAMMNLDSADC